MMSNKLNTRHLEPDDPRIINGFVRLGYLAMEFGRIDRVIYHIDGITPESDTDHTFMLSILACAFAERYLPTLDLGFVSQFSVIHDFVEVYAGDTSTFRINSADRINKAKKEHQALIRFKREFGSLFPWLTNTMEQYESLNTPEARYVKAFDKLMPDMTHILNQSAYFKKHNISQKELINWFDQLKIETSSYTNEFSAVVALRDYLRQEIINSSGLPD